MPVVVVESPAKAKTINKYLGSDYTVLASYGHVRDLPAKDGSVDTEQDFEMKWEVGADSRKHVKAIADALSNLKKRDGRRIRSHAVLRRLQLGRPLRGGGERVPGRGDQTRAGGGSNAAGVAGGRVGEGPPAVHG